MVIYAYVWLCGGFMITHSYICVVLEYLETVPPKPLVVNRTISPTCESLFVMGLDVLRNDM